MLIYRPLVTVAFAATLVLSGCSDDTPAVDDTSAVQSVDDLAGQATAEQLVQASNAETGFNETLDSNNNLANTTRVPVLRYEETGEELRVFFEMESQSCYGINATAPETGTDVTVTLEVGLLSDAKVDDCGIGVYSYQTIVDLEEPVGDRVVNAIESNGAVHPVGEDVNLLEVPLDRQGRPDPGQFEALTIDQATDLAEGNAISWTVLSLDGEPQSAPTEGVDLAFVVEGDIVVRCAPGSRQLVSLISAGWWSSCRSDFSEWYFRLMRRWWKTHRISQWNRFYSNFGGNLDRKKFLSLVGETVRSWWL